MLACLGLNSEACQEDRARKIEKKNRDDKTPLELFLAGVRALALQSRIIDVVRIAPRFSSGTGGH